jgi:hypothetical protein
MSVNISKTTFVLSMGAILILSIAISYGLSTMLVKEGPQGVQGPQGSQGPIGPKGEKGDPGPKIIFAKWNVTWRTLTSDMNWGTIVGSSQFCSTFDYNWESGALFLEYDDYIGFQAVMEVKMQRDGPVSFTIGSDDASSLYIDGAEGINLWGAHFYTMKSITVDLSKGTHILSLWYHDLTGDAKVTFDCDSDILMWPE